MLHANPSEVLIQFNTNFSKFNFVKNFKKCGVIELWTLQKNLTSEKCTIFCNLLNISRNTHYRTRKRSKNLNECEN